MGVLYIRIYICIGRCFVVIFFVIFFSFSLHSMAIVAKISIFVLTVELSYSVLSFNPPKSRE